MIRFEPIEENILLPLPNLNAEMLCDDLAAGRMITYSTNHDVKNSKVELHLLEKNDFDEFQKIGHAEIKLENGIFEDSIWFVSCYDPSFELGTIDVCAQLTVINPNYQPTGKPDVKKSSRRGRNIKKTGSRTGSSRVQTAKSSRKKPLRPKSSALETIDDSKILDPSKIIEGKKIGSDFRDVGAELNPPPLFYQSKKVLSASSWSPTIDQRILNRLNETPVSKSVIFDPPKPPGSARVLKPMTQEVTSTDLSQCPLVTQIIDELDLLNTQYRAARSRDLQRVSSVSAISDLKEFTARSPNNFSEIFAAVDQSKQDLPENDPDEQVSTIPIQTRRRDVTPPVQVNSNIALRASSSRLRQSVPSGTYDRYGNPLFKPVFSDLALLHKPLLDQSISVQYFGRVSSNHDLTSRSSEVSLRSRDTRRSKSAMIQTRPTSAIKKSSSSNHMTKTLTQQTVLNVDLMNESKIGISTPPPPTPTPRSMTNQSLKTSLHISLPSVTDSMTNIVTDTVSHSATSVSQTSQQYSDDFTDDESSISTERSLDESFEKSRSIKVMLPQRSASPLIKARRRT